MLGTVNIHWDLTMHGSSFFSGVPHLAWPFLPVRGVPGLACLNRDPCSGPRHTRHQEISLPVFLTALLSSQFLPGIGSVCLCPGICPVLSWVFSISVAIAVPSPRSHQFICVFSPFSVRLKLIRRQRRLGALRPGWVVVVVVGDCPVSPWLSNPISLINSLLLFSDLPHYCLLPYHFSQFLFCPARSDIWWGL